MSFVARLLKSEKIIFEKHEHYVKQTYRNRALVYGANGIHPLVIPVHHEGNERKPISERKISYDSQWQKIHWRTLTSSYRNTPYFEYFEDELKGFYETKTEFLFEFNLLLLKKIFALVQIPFNPEFTSAYEKTLEDGIADMRSAFLPASRKIIPEYHQAFADKHGFIPDLSIVDLLFNKGMGAKEYLTGIKANTDPADGTDNKRS